MTRYAVLPALILSMTILPSSVFATDDGTYRTLKVKNMAECSAACKADPNCRGMSMLQPDRRKPGGQCMLNNGLGEDSPFKIPTPDNINIDTVLADMNAYRAENGLAPLKWNDTLALAAKRHSDDMAEHGMIAHEGTDGSTPDSRTIEAGYIFARIAENVAAGQLSWEGALEGWKKSPGHDANLLRNGVTEIGVSLTHDPSSRYINYWAMVLASQY